MRGTTALGAAAGAIVDCPACWFPGGAPARDDREAAKLAGEHDRMAHGGTRTAVVRPVDGSGGPR